MNDVNKTKDDSFSCEIINDGLDLLTKANIAKPSLSTQQFSKITLPTDCLYVYQIKFAIASSQRLDNKQFSHDVVQSVHDDGHDLLSTVLPDVNHNEQQTMIEDGFMDIKLEEVDKFIQQNPTPPKKSTLHTRDVLIPKPTPKIQVPDERDFAKEKPFTQNLTDNIANELQQIDVYNQTMEVPIAKIDKPSKILTELPTPPTPTITPVSLTQIEHSFNQSTHSTNNHKVLPRASKKAKKTKQNIVDRFYTSLLVMLIYMLIGLVIDGSVNIVRSLVSTDNVRETFWLFLPLLSVLGLILGVLFGSKSLDALFAMFRSNRTPINNESNFATGALQAIGLGLLIAFVAWFGMMIFAS